MPIALEGGKADDGVTWQWQPQTEPLETYPARTSCISTAQTRLTVTSTSQCRLGRWLSA